MSRKVIRSNFSPIWVLSPFSLDASVPPFQVNWWRTQSLLVSTKGPGEKQSMKVFGNRTHAMIPGVKPFSEYRLSFNVFTKKGNGPSSLPVTFTTPQGGTPSFVPWDKKI